MKIFGFEIKKAPVARNSNDRPSSPVGAWQGGRRSVVEYANVVSAENALEHPVVFRCLNKIATSVQHVRWFAEADPDAPLKDRAGERVLEELNGLLQDPNDNLAADQLRYWMALNYAVYGRIPLKVGVGVAGNANGVYPLETRYVIGVSSGKGSIDSYEYGATSKKDVMPSRRAAAKSETKSAYVYEIATPNLAASLETGKNITALGAIGLPTQVIRLLLQRAADTASGHPNTKYIVAAEKTLTNKQKDAIKEQIEDSATGDSESGGVLFVYNTKIDVHKLDNDLSDIHSKMPLDDMSRLIAGAFGIPISLLGLGAADGAKFAGNYIESRRSFWEDTIIPNYLTPIATGMTGAICPRGARIRFDLDTIDAIQDIRIARAKDLAEVPFLTTTEKRELIGFEPTTVLPEIIESSSANKPTTKQEPSQ